MQISAREVVLVHQHLVVRGLIISLGLPVMHMTFEGIDGGYTTSPNRMTCTYIYMSCHLQAAIPDLTRPHWYLHLDVYIMPGAIKPRLMLLLPYQNGTPPMTPTRD